MFIIKQFSVVLRHPKHTGSHSLLFFVFKDGDQVYTNIEEQTRFLISLMMDWWYVVEETGDDK